jgi:RpiR family carbohydrate utilization transcriptional regulator
LANIIDKIKTSKASLSKSELKVATVVLAEPNAAIRSSIASLARQAKVSEPTVNRFCRSLGCTGFPDFKLKLAQSLASGGLPYVNRNVEATDKAKDYATKIFEAAIGSLDDMLHNLNPEVIDQAVNALSQARRIDFYGIGDSGAVAMDAQHKFFTLNIPVAAYVDASMQRMAAAGCYPGDVVVCISYSGRTITIVETAEVARNSGATVIGITTPNSPLAKICSIVLEVETPEDAEIYMPMTSRLVQLTLIDVLAIGVTLRRGTDFIKHLKKIKDSAMQQRFPLVRQEQDED